MNNTVLQADAQSVNDAHMIFVNEGHEKFYYEKLKQAEDILTVEQVDCCHKALFYILGISEDTRRNFSRIYDMKTGCIHTKCLQEGWQTRGSTKVVRLAFNLYTDGMPSVEDYKCGEERINESRGYSVSDIFCCSYAMYFWEGIRLRYPEYCRKQKSVEEILAEMERRENRE